jgi:hypothetical protein
MLLASGINVGVLVRLAGPGVGISGETGFAPR